jgi:chemotaxis signal transduction protein
MALKFRDFYKPKDRVKPSDDKHRKAKGSGGAEKPKGSISATPPAVEPKEGKAVPKASGKKPVLSYPKISGSGRIIPGAKTADAERNYAIFLVGPEWFGIDLNSILEILHDFDLIPVPHLPAAFAGVTNLRGESLPVVDLPKLLKEPVGTAGMKSCLITIVGRTKIGFLVDSDVEIVNIEAGRLYPLPGFYTKGETKFLEGIFWFKDKFIGIIKPEPTLEALTEWRIDNEEK